MAGRLDRAKALCREGLKPVLCVLTSWLEIGPPTGRSSLYLSILIIVAASCSLGAVGPPTVHVAGDELGAWPSLLGSVGVRAARETATGGWAARVSGGEFLVLEGDCAAGRAFGFRPTARRLKAINVEDLRNPKLDIIWAKPQEVAVFEMPADARVFARERWNGAPLVAGLRQGAGAVLWLALPPGDQGFERFPYLLHALSDLGLQPPFRSNRLWAFFDSSYRAQVDPDYFAERWKRAGIRGLHVAAWHFFDPDPAHDEYLQRMIESCHRQGILVYAWLELPHVSEKFWNDHPEWREKTALLQDAQLDWRKLMNLANGECFQAAASGTRRLIRRFDWDGVNLAELYFESLQGHENPSRFTPMNEDVRRGFSQKAGFDPLELFDTSSRRHYSSNLPGLRRFLDFRAEILRGIQKRWLEVLESERASRADLDLVVTQVDDRLDQGMQDAIAADSASVLALLNRHDFTFLVEDPATVWHLGPERYRELARRYSETTPGKDRLAVDINIAERYQDVYPTRQQTGVELFLLVSHAVRAFPRVALYSENSIATADVPWLASAAAVVDRCEFDGKELVVESPRGAGLRWSGPGLVDGRLWPAADGETLWLPPGRHAVRPASQPPELRLLDLTGELTGATVLKGGLEFSYQSTARALATVDKRPQRVEVDGAVAHPATTKASDGFVLVLPRGQHSVRAYFE